jgi:hypothetical protein
MILGRGIADEPVLLVPKARPLMNRGHSMLLITVKPYILSHVGQVASLRLLYGFSKWLVAHSLEFSALWAVLQGARWWRIE